MIFGPYPGVVLSWHDGDTCRVDVDLGFGIHATAFNLRVYGINAPELNTDAGKLARDFAAVLCPPGSRVLIMSRGWDKYGGRFDGEITLPDGQDFARQMVAGGHAVVL